ncbi:MAG: tyrosine-type recombinase/integrase [Actinomycetia bacterium]|nr:tyrosine-type recombinase/integrase [Actinomycetes bacterium]
MDLSQGLLRVHASKFKKSRLVPLHRSTTEALQRYAERRTHYRPLASSQAFFLTERATSLKYWRTLMTFTALRRQLGWEAPGRRNPPRLHDLRHTFAVTRLLRWYEEGIDLDRRIHALATHLGHVRVTETYWCLTAVPELLAVVSARFETFTRKVQEEAS